SDGGGLPRFVEREFREFLTCGALSRGFARVRCESCAFERLVPFSCKRRGFCPSCGGRRMAEQAAHLVDHVLPHVPVRQWVLTLPHRLRYLLAYNHALCRAVLGVAARAVLGFYRRRARRTRDGRSGAVTVIQRFGGGLQLNVHFHTLLLDGVFAEGEDGSLEFHAAEPPSDEEVARLLATIYRRVQRLLARLVLAPLTSEWHDGTTHLLFTPVELLEKLAALTPRPRVNLVLYHGILAPRARARARAVAHGAPSPGERLPTAAEEPGPDPSPPTADVSGTAPAENPGDAKETNPPEKP